MTDTRRLIIEAAKDLFSRKGYAAVRTKEIAQKAGVNETTLFRHFKGKRELFEQIIMMNMQTIDNRQLLHSKTSGILKDDLEAIATQLYMIYQSNAQIIKMIMKDIIEKDDSLKEYASECSGAHIRKYLIHYFKEMKLKNKIVEDETLLAEIFMNCMNGYLLSSFILEDKEADLDHLLKMVRKLVLIIT